MNIMSKIGGFIKANRSEILTATSIIAGGAAVGFAIHESGNMKKRLHSNREEITALKANHDSKTIDDAEYKKQLAKLMAKTAGNVAYDMKGTIICEAVSIGTSIASVVLGKKAYRAASALASSALATTAFLEEGIRAKYGDEALRELKKPKVIHGKKKVIDPETGKSVTKEYDVHPTSEGIIDQKAYDLCTRMQYPYSAGTILLDDRFSVYKASQNNIENLLFNLRTAQQEATHDMWNSNSCKNTIWDTINYLGLVDANDTTINKSLATMIGTIDNPEAYDYLSKSYVRVPGFDDDGLATQYGEGQHKYLSFGDELDKVLFNPVSFDTVDLDKRLSYQMITDPDTNRSYLLLDLSYDGNVANIAAENTFERKVLAWSEHSEMEK